MGLMIPIDVIFNGSNKITIYNKLVDCDISVKLARFESYNQIKTNFLFGF
jgi:hypothetical protein